MTNLPIIELRNIKKEFVQGSTRIEIIKGINLTIYQGELIAIIGESGSGKSTLLQIMGLLDKISSGALLFDGVNISDLSEKQKELTRLQKLGFIYQAHHLLRDFTAQENVLMPALIANKKYEEQISKAEEMLSQLGIFERRFSFPGQLSGGEQQRVAIARALFNEPKLLLADEPTGNLDPMTGNEVFNLLLNLVKEKKLATVIVTHNHSLARQADKIFELREGLLHQL